ncbi:EI24 domain-containing protein [Paracraurococcus ruber]|uniref:Cysteine biosynthesis protein CysZ n=1 Tax=Paracraurococcus ruber TaxID=77675 RepID=A0ABS1D178_9PROT|nr:EI24 domain-containing protein [Paracraurococcus ruber]MBK1660052.1 cysteine biosynthesis protein CysZ [Paracraurococcus ruber]TDG28105.1 cysteine biosynthesis protein CysZ [Paracraurococcus ruber]
MLAAITLTVRQLPDPAFLAPLAKSLLGAALVFAALAGLAAWGTGWLAGGTGWLAQLAAAAGGLLTLGLAYWLFIPAMLAISGLFLDPVAAAVERRFYPSLPPARGAGLGAQARYNLALGAKVAGVSLLALPLALLAPPFGALAFWLISTVALGHGLFEGVAQRRMSVADSRALRRRRQWPVLTLGALLAALALVPVVNLLVPIIGTAAMTHLLHRE